jgi:NAD-dependent deacetylase
LNPASARGIPQDLIEALRGAERVVALTGSGISAESGVPTFREAQTGLWECYDPQQLATPEAFERNPRLVWEWYEWRRQLVTEAEPNPGHLALVELKRRVPCFTLVTQNVDGLHGRAGSQGTLELQATSFARVVLWRGMFWSQMRRDRFHRCARIAEPRFGPT